MPKLLPSDLLDRVAAALSEHPDGLALADLEDLFGDVASRRSLQRRLETWVRDEKIRAEGRRRGRRYFNSAANSSATLTPTTGQVVLSSASPHVDEGVPVSEAGREILAFVRRPLIDRQPIGYRREFLEAYVPNKLAYLPPVVTSHLHELGRTQARERPAGTYARDVFDRLLIDLSWSSSRLEGNTYSLLDTTELIERGTAAPGKDAKETQMILNHKAAIELLVDSAEDVGVNRYTITNLHALLADNLLEDPRDAGRLRETPVAIAGSSYIPTAVPQLVEEMFSRLLDTAVAIVDPFEQAFFLLVHVPYLQPFIDVNQRTSRLASNIPLIKRNLVPLSFIDVPERTYVDGLIGIYESNRIELLRDVFVWAYERSVRRYKTVRDSLPEPDPFRLKYRAELTEAVSQAVRQRAPVTKAAITKLTKRLIASKDATKFVDLVLAELRGLHEGNIARFRLRPSEFRQWSRR